MLVKVKDLKNKIDKFIVQYEFGTLAKPLDNSMRYTLNLPSKRIRSILFLSALLHKNIDINQGLVFCLGIEMIQAYSLIHDDLPALDNDDIRRGKPSNHKVYGEANAILTGDALLNTAYELMLKDIKDVNHLNALIYISENIGINGMIGGQVADINFSNNINFIHEHKTSDFIKAAIVSGFIFAGTDKVELLNIEKYGYNIGMAFQIIDDILDIISTSDVLGKSIGKDIDQNKNTWVKCYGIEKAREDAKMYTDTAIEAISKCKFDTEFYIDYAKKLLERIF